MAEASSTISPRLKRWLVIAGAGAALLGLLYVFVGGGSSKREIGDSRRTVDSIITNADTSEATITGIAARLTAIERSIGTFQTQLDGVSKRQQDVVKAMIDALRRDIGANDARTRAELDAMERRLMDAAGLSGSSVGAPSPPLPDPIVAPAPPPEPAPAPATVTPPVTPPPPAPPSRRSLAPGDVFAGSEPVPAPGGPGPAAPPPGAAVAAGGQTIRMIHGAKPPEGAAAAAGGVPGRQVTLPSGSIISGVLLSGLDAPTGTAAQKDPVPMLLRIKHTAILPNRFSADVRECFILLSAYGELSSERAQMRGERISCVLASGAVVEQKLEGFASGEDGKQGLRGRVVTKQGQFIARALLVGLMQGAAQALGEGGTSGTVRVDSGGNLSASGDRNALDSFFSGQSKALDRIADFYLEQAEQIFPVIEVDVGRQVNVILTQPLTIRLDI